MKKLFVLGVALVMMFLMTGCNVLTERVETYSIQDGVKVLESIRTYDSDGKLIEVVEFGNS